MPQFSYELLDLSLRSPREIVGNALVRTTFSAMHSIFDPNLNQHLPEILKTLASGTPAEVKFLETIVRYFVAAGSLNESDVSAALTVSFPQQVSQLMPTLAETWIERGKQEGIELGKQEGIELGKQEGKHDTLLLVIARLLAQKLGRTIEPALQAKLENLSSAELDRLTGELLHITTEDELRQWLAQH